MGNARADVIEMCDGDDTEWVPVPSKCAVKMDNSTWEVAVPDVNERRRFRVNGTSCSWRRKSGDLRVLLRKIP
jgi:hypothetical protein